MPSDLNLTVSTLQDVLDPNDNELSLREAIIQANDAVPDTYHTISFASSLAGGTLTLSDSVNRQQLTISEKTLISGPTSGNITIRRDPNSLVKYRVLQIQETFAHLRRLNITDGSVSGSGGGVLADQSDLIVTECTISNNSATSGGGGICSTGVSGSLLIYDSDINSNKAEGSGGGHGGGISIGSMVTTAIYNSQIYLNTADLDGGGIAIYPATTPEATSVTLDGVEVFENEAQAKGGGIYVETTAETEGGAELTLTGDTSIHDNIAGTNGGGIYFGTGTITLAGVTIADNDASAGDGMYRVTGTIVSDDPDVTYTNDAEAVGS